jgi:hypothetical protein
MECRRQIAACGLFEKQRNGCDKKLTCLYSHIRFHSTIITIFECSLRVTYLIISSIDSRGRNTKPVKWALNQNMLPFGAHSLPPVLFLTASNCSMLDQKHDPHIWCLFLAISDIPVHRWLQPLYLNITSFVQILRSEALENDT